MAVTISRDELVRHLNKAVEIRGADFVYQRVPYTDGCLNWHGGPHGRPGCIIGYIVYEILKEHVSEDEATTWMATHVEGSSYDLAEALKADHSIRLGEGPDLMMLRRIQARQDDGIPWGQAVEEILGSISEEGEKA